MLRKDLKKVNEQLGRNLDASNRDISNRKVKITKDHKENREKRKERKKRWQGQEEAERTKIVDPGNSSIDSKCSKSPRINTE